MTANVIRLLSATTFMKWVMLFMLLLYLISVLITSTSYSLGISLSRIFMRNSLKLISLNIMCLSSLKLGHFYLLIALIATLEIFRIGLENLNTIFRNFSTINNYQISNKSNLSSLKLKILSLTGKASLNIRYKHQSIEQLQVFLNFITNHRPFH